MRYKCNNCGCKFTNPIQEKTTYESYFGVGGTFPNSTPLTINLCPRCQDEDIEEYEENKEYEKEDK